MSGRGVRHKTAYQAFVEGDTTTVSYRWIDGETVLIQVTTRDGRVGRFKARRLYAKDQEILEDEELREVDRR